jgi:UPF0271 protein
MKLDLNCDLGEGEPLARTRTLMRWISSANVACGGHAGDVNTMAACVRLAKQYRVRLGAHPGPWNRRDFGRGPVQITAEELELLLLHQVGPLERLARAEKVRLHHIKLHGALYHASEADDSLARRYLATVARWWPGAKIYARAGGTVARLAKGLDPEVWEEAFVDRAYQDNGSLVPRYKPGALLTSVGAVQRRVHTILDEGCVVTSSGRRLRVQPRSLCLHADTPHAAQLARVVARGLR